MYKVKFKTSGDVYDLVGFNGNKIVIRFNHGQSIGTVPKAGYELLGDKTYEQIEEELKQYIIKGKGTGRISGKENKDG